MAEVIPLKQPASFEDFWKLCPKKIGKPIARFKWDAITSEQGLSTRALDKDSGMYVEIHLKATPEELIKGMKAYRDSQQGGEKWAWGLVEDGRFTSHPSTWLNRGRWMDG